MEATTLAAMIGCAVRFGLVMVLACVVLMFPSGVRAQDTGWTIERFDSQIHVNADASFDVREAIDVDFGSLQKHGIFRDIPVLYSYDASHDRLFGFERASVVDGNGAPVSFKQSRDGANVRLQIGNANRTVSGKQSYRISYRIRDGLNAFTDHDELYWNVNGPAWQVPTRQVSAFVTLDGGGITRVQCYEGATGATASCNHLGDEARVGFVSTRAFNPRDQLTIVTGFAKGAVSEPRPNLVDRPVSGSSSAADYFAISRWTLAGAAITTLAGLAFLALNWWRNGRDRIYTSIYYLSKNPQEETRPFFHRDDIVVEYTPPEKLMPAEMGLLLDERVDQKDVTATIIDLAVRGYLSIEEIVPPGFLRQGDWLITRKRDPKDLAPHERILFKGLLGDRSEVHLADLQTDYVGALWRAQKRLYDDSVKSGWFPSNPESTRAGWRWRATYVVVVAGIATIIAGSYFGAAIVGLPLVATGLLIAATASWMPKRTARGSEMLRRVLGFRLYIETAEKDRQQFNERAEIFAAYLPYAIVCGCAEKWARVFGEIDTTKAVSSWYTGGAGFGALALSSHLQGFSASVAHSVNTAAVNVPAGHGSSGFGGSGFSGGGGFGGGGFSGGGGGGGGGGSW